MRQKYLITGVSSGLGRGLVKRLVGEENEVFGIARRGELLKSLKAELPDGGKFHFAQVDLARRGAVNRLINEMRAVKFWPEVVVLNAAVSSDDLRETFEVNFFANVELVEKLMAKGKRLHFVAISTASALKGSGYEEIGYGASKASLSLAFESFHHRHRHSNFSFSTVFFGPIKTGMYQYKQKRRPYVTTEEKAVDVILAAAGQKLPIYYHPKSLFLAIYLLRILPSGIGLGIVNILEKLHRRL